MISLNRRKVFKLIMENIIIYTHIEKNAGTTLHYILNENYPYYITLNPGARFRNNRPFGGKALERLIRLTNNNLQGVGGHTIFPYYDYQSAISDERKVFLFTFLRNPVKRYLSHLNYRKNVMNQDWNLQEFLNCGEFTNFQTKKIAGKEDFKKAKAILDEKFSFVGFVEMFDESLLMLKQSLGGIDVHYERENTANKAKQPYELTSLTNTEIKAIKNANEEDIKLYDYAKNVLFSKQREQYRGNIEEELIAYNIENGKYKFKSRKRILFKIKNQIVKFVLQPIALK